MNIFVLDKNPWSIPKHYCNLHVNKMLTETAQLLSNCHPEGSTSYKRTHYNHPCSIWARTTKSNYIWLFELGMALYLEYMNRYDKTSHKSGQILAHQLREVPEGIPDGELTEWPECVLDEFKTNNPIKDYRRYYAYKLRDFRRRGICKFNRVRHD